MIHLSDDENIIVTSILKKSLKDVEVWVFGSRTSTPKSKYSDLDLVIKGKHSLPLLTLSKLTEDFSESNLPFKVELVDWHRITEEFQIHIQQNWVQLVCL